MTGGGARKHRSVELDGIAGSGGFAIGRAMVVATLRTGVAHRRVLPTDIAHEVTRFDQAVSQATVSRELLITMSCFSRVSPGEKTWSLLVKRSGLPAIYASSGRLLRSNECAAAVGIQSERS